MKTPEIMTLFAKFRKLMGHQTQGKSYHWSLVEWSLDWKFLRRRKNRIDWICTICRKVSFHYCSCDNFMRSSEKLIAICLVKKAEKSREVIRNGWVLPHRVNKILIMAWELTTNRAYSLSSNFYDFRGLFNRIVTSPEMNNAGKQGIASNKINNYSKISVP